MIARFNSVLPDRSKFQTFNHQRRTEAMKRILPWLMVIIAPALAVLGGWPQLRAGQAGQVHSEGAGRARVL